jgi:hypothetical protein
MTARGCPENVSRLFRSCFTGFRVSSAVFELEGRMAVRAGSVERAVRADLRKLGCSVQDDGLAALAVSLARQVDNSVGATAAAAAAGQLRVILADLAKSSSGPGVDAIDELNARRAVRRAAEG